MNGVLASCNVAAAGASDAAFAAALAPVRAAYAQVLVNGGSATPTLLPTDTAWLLETASQLVAATVSGTGRITCRGLSWSWGGYDIQRLRYHRLSSNLQALARMGNCCKRRNQLGYET